MKKINLIKRLWKTDSHEKQTPQRFKRYAGMLMMLLTLGVGQMWAEKGFWSSGQWNVKYYDGSGSDKWIGEGNDGATKDLGIKTTLYLKGSWVKTWSNGGWTQSSVVWNYGLSSSYGNTKTATKSSVQGDQTWDFSVDYNVIANAPNNPGQNTIYMYWRLDNYVSSTASYINFTIPGFKKTSVSQDFGNVTVSSTKDLTISFTQHYGTTLTASNCSITGTNSGDFTVTSISETGVTVRFAPAAAGSRSATLTITDAHSKTCTITLTGTGTAAATATLTYHANWYTTGTSGSVPSSQTVAVDATATVAGRNTLAMTNYTFSGWNTEEYITGTHYNAGDDITMDEDKDLYAVWTRSITLNQNGATTNGTTSVTGTYNCSTLPSITNPKKTGYTFVGWRTENNGTGNLVINTSGQLQSGVYHWTDETTPSNRFQRKPSSTSPLYATWTQDITLNANTSNHGSGSNKTGTVIWNGTSITISTHCTPASGYSLDGYYTAATGGTKILNADKSFAGSNITVSGDPYISSGKWVHPGATTLYAQYTPIQYTISFNKQSGSSGTNSATVHFNNNDFSVSPVVAPTRTGYTFGGYYTSTGGSGEQIVNASGVWQNSKTNYLDGSGNWIYAGNKTLYAKWTENMTTVTLAASPTDKGTFTSGGGAVTSVSAGATTKPSVTAVPATGYRVNTSATVWTKSNSNITLSSTTTNPVTVTGCGTSGTSSTLTATFTPKTYTITLHEQGATTHGSPSDGGTITVTYDATTNINTGLSPAITAPLKTGYNFGGYWNSSACTDKQLIKVDGWFNYDVSGYTDDGAWVHDGNVDLYAKWVANKYTITFDKQTSAEGYYSGGTWDASKSVYYDGDVPSISGTIPTAANGYKFVGFYTEEDGGGEKIINADKSWIASVSGYTDENTKWVRANDATLYAYYKKAEITALTVTPAVVATEGTVAVTPTIDPMPEGTTEICWELQYSNGTPLPSQPIFSQGPDNSVIFQAPAASATYRIQATLRKGSTCDAGDVLSTAAQTFQVAGEHTVTVQYQDGDGRTLKDTIHIIGRPLEWTTLGDITPPAITGYKFARWDAGDGVTIKNGDSDPVTTTTTSSIQIKAVYDGTLTAVYTKKKMIYFYNTLGWSDVYVYFYNTDEYWSDTYGSGAQKTQAFNGNHKPYWEEEHGHMTQIEGTNIWYFDYEAAGYTTHRSNVAFTEADKHDTQWFYETKAVRRGDHNAALPMFVPLTTKTETKNKTDYYNNGYWMNYPENTGYTLRIYSSSDADLGSGYTREIAFPFSDDIKMPLKIDVEFNDANNHDYWFIVKKNDGNYHGKDYTFNQNYNNEQTLNSSSTKCKLVTSAPGNYTFTLTYHDGNYYIDVDFPIATGDYRIFYKDNATWSQGAHGTDWNHPSDVIAKINGEATEAKTDIVSFYISKGAGITPSMKFQYASAISDAGAVTWSDVASGTINLSSFSSDITEAGVYNIYVSQPVGGTSITVDSIKPYKGNFYIRTDCAGDTKWDSYKTLDHQMTYSDYAKDNSGFTHYFVHWVTSGTNVKFVIANDYSPCISDTLSQDYGTAIANISSGGALNSANANIRFMWNQSTNKISRAYIGGSGIITDRFLVLEGDAKMYDEYGHALTGDYQDHDQYNNYLGTDDQVIMHDDQNFLYERIIKVNTSARAKLTAKYNDKVQYFKGSEGAFAEGTTVELLGGSASGKHKMRIVYDFKTNRLVTAYLPEGEIDTDLAINADLMLVREHQEEGQQITFNGGSLTDVHTVYGVMRFNRWTLNNKEKTGAHGPVGDPKSVYERSLYWISFPFDVNLSDVFGFGTYGEDWIIEYYDGESRAANGYWIDSPSFWRFVMPAQRPSFTLEAGKGYVLALEIANMKYDNTDFWTNNIEQVELFFPSTENVGGIEATDVTTSVHEHACTIDRTGNGGSDINKNRTRADSHWNMIGVPSYANYGETLTSDGSTVITWNSAPYTNDLPFLYEWNMVDDSYTVQSGTTYPFKSMHSYMVQYHGELHWALASASPVSAPRFTPDELRDREFRLELQQNDIRADQTFVKLSNNENVSADFVFDEDLSKEFNKKKANIYTLIDYIPAAGNVLPLSTSQKTIVPVGVQIKTDGEYTFSMPDGTEGIGITLIDNETGEHTNLGLTDYTVNLNAGSINDRFVLEISAIQGSTTDLQSAPLNDGMMKARKVMIDGILYIVRDGKVFDARGARVQ